jgi:hypothetical protein
MVLLLLAGIATLPVEGAAAGPAALALVAVVPLTVIALRRTA